MDTRLGSATTKADSDKVQSQSRMSFYMLANRTSSGGRTHILVLLQIDPHIVDLNLEASW
jgi:hypothetical protein